MFDQLHRGKSIFHCKIVIRKVCRYHAAQRPDHEKSFDRKLSKSQMSVILIIYDINYNFLRSRKRLTISKSFVIEALVKLMRVVNLFVYYLQNSFTIRQHSIQSALGTAFVQPDRSVTYKYPDRFRYLVTGKN